MVSMYDPTSAINTLWSDIMNVHWQFLDEDESMEKLNLRSNLEELILQFLCNIPHERKFLLKPTVQVLKSSIAKLEEFSAYKASIGFEAISQYANNLFRKPWRKEYKVIKMYSGFYQHEIAANLVGAEVLFEEMGYRTLPNQTMILDDPVCPDRVTNVSRDAIIANVECQIMKEICHKLTDMALPVNWSDIYSFREYNTMNVMQSVHQMAVLITEKHQKTQSQRKESYGNALAPAVSSCNSCNPYQIHPHMQQLQQPPVLPPPPLTVHQQPSQIPFCGSQPLYNTAPCSVHNQPPGLIYGYHPHNSYQPYLPTSPTQPHTHPSSQSTVIPPHPPPPLGAIPHSKSLDHYQVPAAAMHNLTACMQRHSIDQTFDYAAASSASHYGGPMGMAPPTGAYDAVDGCNIAYNSPYNVSGNRFPLPYNLSTNLGPCMNDMTGKQNGNEPFYQQPSINGYPQMGPYYHHRSNSNGQSFGQQQQQQQQMHRMAADIYMNHNFDHIGTGNPPSILSKKKTSYDDNDIPSVSNSGDNKQHSGDLIFIDTREKERKKSVRNADLLVDYESGMLPDALLERNQQQQQHRHRYLHHQTSRNSRQSDFDSYEDEQLQVGASQRANNVSKRISSKTQDGFGSYESWSYVFQNLEKRGYNKDLGERCDLLNDDDAEEFTECSASRGGTIKRSSNDKLKAMKAKAADKVDGIRISSAKSNQLAAAKHDRDNERNEQAARTLQKSTAVQKQTKSNSNNQADNSHKASSTSNPTNNGNTSTSNGGSSGRRNSINRKNSTTTKENGVSTAATNAGGGGILVNNSSNHQSSSASGKKKTTSFDTAAVTIINTQDDRDKSRSANDSGTSVREWNCEFCTFLNPDTKRICEICSKSRNVSISSGTTTTATSNGTATCV